MLSNKIGKLGEDIAVNYLKKSGFMIIERNYLRKTGEIDIICEKTGTIHFVEVKSVSRRTSDSPVLISPEENLHSLKAKRLSRTIEVYMTEKDMKDRDFQIDLIAVVIETYSKRARIRVIQDIIL